MGNIFGFYSKHLTVKVLSGVVCMLLLGIGTIASIFFVVSGQKTDSMVINDAGKLRMLSQKISKAAFLVVAGDETAREELESTITLFDHTFKTVQSGDPARGIPPAPPELVPQLHVVEQNWDSLQTNVSALLNLPAEGLVFEVTRGVVKEKNLKLLVEANKAVQLFEKEANAKIIVLFNVLYIFLGLTIVAFVGVFLIVRKSITPINELVATTKEVVRGNLDAKVTMQSKDEVGILGESFNTMVSNIKKGQEALIEEKRNVELTTEEAMRKARIQEEYLSNSVNRILSEMNKLAEGDLTVQLHIDKDDQIGRLCKGFNRAVQRVQRLLHEVKHTIELTVTAAEGIYVATDKISSSSRQRSSQTIAMVSAIEKMTRTIADNASKASQTADMAGKNGEVAKEGGFIVQQTIQKIRSIADVVGDSAQTVERLGKSTEQIGVVAEVIDDIANQTNLLALNAAIEAARAGEQGRGFAVVADEVRNLAERTTDATQKIARQIQTIQSETEAAVSSMQQGNNEMQSGIALADKAGQALEQIMVESTNTIQLVGQMAVANKEQTAMSGSISESASNISDSTSQTTNDVAQIIKTSDHLNALMSELTGLVEHFKIGNTMTPSEDSVFA